MEQLKNQTRALEFQKHEAEDAREKADEANRAKGQFLAAMSHELRTPLNAIGGYADLISMGLSGPITEQQREQLERIKRSQEHLLGIINDILNFSRIEAGQLVYTIDAVPMFEVLESVTAMMMPQVLKKGLELVPGECPGVYACGDRAKIEQIMINLLSNAVKFTNEGGEIRLSCEIRNEEVEVKVVDTGTGIPKDKLEAIFEPFVQVGRSLSTSREGTGLGLAISRDLARAMDGDIRAKSTVDVGSEFTLTLPVAHPK